MGKNNNLSSAANDKKIRIIILVVTLCLTAGLIVAAVLTGIFSDGYGHEIYDNLTIGRNSIYISSSNDGVYYSFTPYSSGQYIFTSSVSSFGLDPMAVLYDSNWSELASNDDGAGNSNFSLSYYLFSGETYYLQITAYSGSGTATVFVQQSYQ